MPEYIKIGDRYYEEVQPQGTGTPSVKSVKKAKRKGIQPLTTAAHIKRDIQIFAIAAGCTLVIWAYTILKSSYEQPQPTGDRSKKQTTEKTSHQQHQQSSRI